MKTPKNKIGDIYNRNTITNYYAIVGKDVGSKEKKEGDKLLFELIPQDLNGKIVLDLGCGNGRYSELLCQRGAKKVLGLDLNEEMIRQATMRKKEKRLKQLELIRANMNNLPIGLDKIDYIFSRFSLMYADNLNRVMKSLSEILVFGGAVLIEANVFTIQDRKKQANIKKESVPLDFIIGNKSVKFKNFVYTLEDYISAFQKAGLWVVTLKQFQANNLVVNLNYKYKDLLRLNHAIFELIKQKEARK